MSNQGLVSVENEWKIRTEAGNEQFNSSLYTKALDTYQEALVYANRLNEFGSRCEELHIPFVQVFIISCNNIANSYEACGQVEDAEKLLKRAVFFVNHLVLRATPLEIQQYMLDSELNRTVINYTAFCKRMNIKSSLTLLDQALN